MEIVLEHLGSAYGQHDYVMKAMLDGAQVGRIEFNEYEGMPAVSWIEVDKTMRRRHVASRLVQALQMQYPTSMIAFGYSTDDGSKAISRMPWRHEINEDIQTASKLLVELRQRIEWFEMRAGELAESNPTGDVSDLESWNETLDMIDELERVIETQPEQFRFFDLDVSFSHEDPASSLGR